MFTVNRYSLQHTTTRNPNERSKDLLHGEVFLFRRGEIKEKNTRLYELFRDLLSFFLKQRPRDGCTSGRDNQAHPRTKQPRDSRQPHSAHSHNNNRQHNFVFRIITNPNIVFSLSGSTVGSERSTTMSTVNNLSDANSSKTALHVPVKEPPVPPRPQIQNERMESVDSSAYYEVDDYGDYDDFDIGQSGGGGGGGGGGSGTKTQKINRREDNRGGGGADSIYSAKHVRAKEALQKKGK